MKQVIYCLLLCLVTLPAWARNGLQQHRLSNVSRYYYREYTGFDPEKLIFGGNLGMDFIRNADSIYKTTEKGYSLYLTPTIGYRFGRVHAGLNGGYSFTHVNIKYVNFITKKDEHYKLNSSNYSISVFSRLFFLRNFFLHAEPEMNFFNQWEYRIDYFITGKREYKPTRIKVPSILTGIGFVLPIGENVGLVVQGLYDVLQNPNSPYSGLPVIRGGFNVGMY